MKARLGGAALVVAALLACKSQSSVTGSVSFNGAPFETKDCQVSELTSTFGGSPVTTHTVTLVDASKRRLSFSDSGGMRVSYSSGSAFDTIGATARSPSMRKRSSFSRDVFSSPSLSRECEVMA